VRGHKQVHELIAQVQRRVQRRNGWAAALRTRARNGRWEHAPPIWRRDHRPDRAVSGAGFLRQTLDPSSPGCCSRGSSRTGERTWMGHPAHPMLTDVPIGAWTEAALMLDLLGGPVAANGADTLIGIGVLAAPAHGGHGAVRARNLGTSTSGAIAVRTRSATPQHWPSMQPPTSPGRRGTGRSVSAVHRRAGVMMAAAFLVGTVVPPGVSGSTTRRSVPGRDWTPVLADDELGEGEAKLVNARQRR